MSLSSTLWIEDRVERVQREWFLKGGIVRETNAIEIGDPGINLLYFLVHVLGFELNHGVKV